jgi:hypothetical protein
MTYMAIRTYVPTVIVEHFMTVMALIIEVGISVLTVVTCA